MLAIGPFYYFSQIQLIPEFDPGPSVKSELVSMFKLLEIRNFQVLDITGCCYLTSFRGDTNAFWLNVVAWKNIRFDINRHWTDFFHIYQLGKFWEIIQWKHPSDVWRPHIISKKSVRDRQTDGKPLSIRVYFTQNLENMLCSRKRYENTRTVDHRRNGQPFFNPIPLNVNKIPEGSGVIILKRQCKKIRINSTNKELAR